MRTFLNTTTFKGKYQVMSTEELTGKGIRKVGNNSITTYKGKVYGGLKNYWLTKKAVEDLKVSMDVQEVVCF
jgi:hypothetical protein